MSETRTAAAPPTMPAPTQFLTRPGGRIAYDVSGTGPLAVCIPGMGDLRSVYRFLVPTLVDAGWRVATMDLRGHGESEVTFTSYDDVAAAQDAIALVEHLGGAAVLLGNSMGAGAAVWAAAEAPQLVSGLVLFGPWVRDGHVSAIAALGMRLALLRPWGPAAWNAYYARLYPGRKPADMQAYRARIRRAQGRPGAWRAFVATTHTTHEPVHQRLDRVSAPTLVVMGERDADFPDPAAEARFVSDQLHGKLLMVPSAGHYPQAEYPETVTPAVVDFLHGLRPGA